MYTIHVPTKKYLRKYIASKYGHPIRISNNNLIGVMVMSMCTRKVYSKLDLNQRDLRFRHYNDELIFLAPMSSMGFIGLGLEPNAILQLNKFFECMFENDLYEFCKKNINDDVRRKGYDKAISVFAEFHGIELDFDITYEALKKTEFRYRKSLELNYSHSVLSKNHPVKNIR